MGRIYVAIIEIGGCVSNVQYTDEVARQKVDDLMVGQGGHSPSTESRQMKGEKE